MTRAFTDVYARHRDREISMREAAYAAALDRLGAAVRAQGTFEYFARDRQAGDRTV